MPLDQSTIQHIVAQATAKNAVVKTATDHIIARTEAMRNDQEKILEKLVVSADNSNLKDSSATKLRISLLNYLTAERNNFAIFNHPTVKSQLPPQIASQRMFFIFNKFVNDITKHEELTPKIMSGIVGDWEQPESYYDHLPILRTNSFWGSNEATLTSAMLLSISFAFSAENIANYFQSSIAHATACPTLPEEFNNSRSKFHMHYNNQNYFGFAHGGYAFGGARGEPMQYQFGPEDCSSIVAKWLHTAKYQTTNYSNVNFFSTLHMFYHHRSRTSANFFDGNVYTPTIKKEFNSAFIPVTQPDRLQAGDIFVTQSFSGDPNTIDQRSPIGGHTGVVVDYHPYDNSKVLALECARNMEVENRAEKIYGCAGCGVGEYSVLPEVRGPKQTTRTVFLRPIL